MRAASAKARGFVLHSRETAELEAVAASASPLGDRRAASLVRGSEVVTNSRPISKVPPGIESRSNFCRAICPGWFAAAWREAFRVRHVLSSSAILHFAAELRVLCRAESATHR